MRVLGLILIAMVSAGAHAQWAMQQSHTTASLRGIHNVGGGVAWASGTNGTVIHTEDGGSLWQTCSMPPGAEKLDFRGIQAFDKNTAIVMSSGKGDLSRLYKTTDGCQSWKLVFTNPDKDGFWDAIQFSDELHGFLLGDPVSVAGSGRKRVVFKQTIDGAKTWISWERNIDDFAIGEDVAAFAASNSSMIAQDKFHAVVAVGGKGGSAIGFPGNNGFYSVDPTATDKDATQELNVLWKLKAPFSQTESGGIFSIATDGEWIVAVGGDYKLPDSSIRTAAYVMANELSADFRVAQTPPHGYRSAVAYDAEHQVWITVGPNGTDVSVDDGKNWHPLTPGKGDAPGADRDWNALSLPFVVGPKGRVGRLNADAVSGLASR